MHQKEIVGKGGRMNRNIEEQAMVENSGAKKALYMGEPMGG